MFPSKLNINDLQDKFASPDMQTNGMNGTGPEHLGKFLQRLSTFMPNGGGNIMENLRSFFPFNEPVMQLNRQMLGPGGTRQLLGPGGTQQHLLGPGGTQQQPNNVLRGTMPNGGGNGLLGAPSSPSTLSSPQLGASPSSLSLPAPFQGDSGGGIGDYLPGIAQIGQGINGLFGGYDNPADSAMPYLDRIGDEAGSHLKPYEQAGAGILGPWGDILKQLMADPNAFFQRFGEGFQHSPGYQYSVDEATKAANQAAAAGGMLGSPAEQAELAKTVSGLANQDFYNYMDRIMNLFGGGLSGAQGLAGIGSNAATSMADLIKQQLMAQAEFAYEGQNAQNQATGGAIGNIINGGLSLAKL